MQSEKILSLFAKAKVDDIFTNIMNKIFAFSDTIRRMESGPARQPKRQSIDITERLR